MEGRELSYGFKALPLKQKILRHKDIYLHRLKIPSTFCGIQIQEKTLGHLILPATEEVLQVEFENLNGSSWLAGGWLNFMIKNNVRPGYCIAFKRVRNWHFEVSRFGLSSLKIDNKESSNQPRRRTKYKCQFVRTIHKRTGEDLTLVRELNSWEY